MLNYSVAELRNLYNNSKPTVLSIQAEGITTTGTPIVWNSKN